MLYAKNVTIAAKELGRKKSTLARWAFSDGCPISARHKTSRGYSLDAVRLWARKRGYDVDEDGKIIGDLRGRTKAVGPVNGGGDPNDPENVSTTEKLRKAQANEREGKAALVQLQLKERTGELISKDDVQDHDRRRHEYMRGTLEMWARSLGPSLAGKTALEITTIMVGKVEDIMRTFSGEEG